MKFIILLCSVSWGQQQSILPVEDLEKEGAIQAIQQMSDSKFSIYGGTITGHISIATITNITEICFKGGACQTSASQNLLSSNNVWTGSNTWTSTITTNGQLHNSSCTTNTMNTNQTFTNTAFNGVAISGSSLAITTNGGSVRVFYTGTCTNDTADARIVLGIYQDAALVSPQTASLGVMAAGDATPTLSNPCGFSFFTPIVSAALHKYYMAGRVSAGTATMNNDNAIGQLCLEEIK